MSEGGLPPGGMSFPQKIHTEDEDFVIELEENMASPPDGYMDDRSRCKRRKRCGQCGPCQVKENCMKCHFCIRKDVLKQTCIYRKCVYLRSKPKPYSRPHQSPQGSGGRISSPREINQTSPVVKSPPASVQAAMFSDQSMPMSDTRPAENPFYPPHLPQPQQQPPQQQPMGSLANHGYVSPPNPMMERAPSIPNASAGSSVNMNMQMNMAPPIQNHATSPPAQKVPCQTPPHSVNSSPAAMAGIPMTSCGNIPLVPSIPPVVPAIPPVLPPMSNSSLPPIPSIPSMPGIMNDRAINDFRHPDQLPLPPHHPHPHFPSVPPVHPHMTHREANLFGDHSRVPHMNFNPTNHMDSSFSRGPNDSSCMYHPGLPYSMPGPFQPSGPSFLSGAADINPFRSNFLNSFPPGYSYPPDRYREGFSTLPFSRLGMPASASFPQYPGQSPGYGMGNSFSQQYSPYNSQHGCPKNGWRPPVSPSIDDVKVLQEGYTNSKDSEKKSSLCSASSDSNDRRAIQEGCEKPFAEPLTPVKHLNDSCADQLRLWNHEYSGPKTERSSSVSSTGSRLSSFWEPWRVGSWLSPRGEEVRSRTSTLSSDFECEISIDDQPMNALVRSDGCNSIEIEFDDRCLGGSEEPSPQKNSASDVMSSVRDIGFRPINRGNSTNADDEGVLMVTDKGLRRIHGGKHLSDDSAAAQNKSAEQVYSRVRDKQIVKKIFFTEPVCLKQDLGEEGIIQLELPGHRVSIEDIVLDEELASKSSDQNELKRFLRKEFVVE